jgi:hypothetical protein
LCSGPCSGRVHSPVQTTLDLLPPCSLADWKQNKSPPVHQFRSSSTLPDPAIGVRPHTPLAMRVVSPAWLSRLRGDILGASPRPAPLGLALLHHHRR